MLITIPKTKRKKKRKSKKVLLKELWNELSPEDKDLQKRYNQQRK
jgi:hypothetical protein